MAVTIDEIGTRAGSGQTWKLGASGDVATTLGFNLTLYVTVAASDTVVVDLSLDNVNWINYGSFTESLVKELPRTPYVRATWGSTSQVSLYGIRIP